jgi:hypothetical protein
MCYVGKLEKVIPKRELIVLLEKEAPAFLDYILKRELPHSRDRLNVPVIVTDDKLIIESLNKTLLQRYLDTALVDALGRRIKFSDFYSRFVATLSQEDRLHYSKIRVAKEIPPNYCKGRARDNNHVYLGNVWWADEELPEPKCNAYYLKDGIMYKEIVE